MQKRPKPGESEEDLLEFQKHFLSQKSAPSAAVVTKKQDSQTAAGPQQKDVVNLQKLPTSLPNTDEAPPAKKSRFKAAQEQRSRQIKSQADGSDNIIDDHDRSTATVLAKIIERDTHSARYKLPAPVTLPFPAVSHFSTDSTVNAQGAPSEKKQKKKSLFAQQVESTPEMFGLERNQFNNEEMQTDEERDSNLGSSASVIDGSGLSATFGRTDVHKIHEENMARLSQMSEQEVLDEQKKLLETLDPKLVAFLKAKKVTHTDGDTGKGEEKDDLMTDSKVSKPVSKSSQDTENTVPLEVKKEWVHMKDIEYDKLEWMKDLPQPSAEHSSNTGQQARFDFNGRLVPPDADIPVNMGLHHHGDEPERAGYTLEELFMLARSTNNQQRVLALNILTNVFKQAKEGNLVSVVQTPILPSVIDAGVIFLLRWSLDDSLDSVVAAAVAALNALLVNHVDELALGKVFHWYQGHRVPFQAPAKPEEVGIKLPGDQEETPEQTDAELAKDDLILALGTRMNLIERLNYILTNQRPQAPVVISILQLLTRLCRHSKQLAHKVFNCKGLLEVVIKEFLPLAWNSAGKQESVSYVYGVAVKEAMRLICVLCQAGRNMAAILLSKFQIEERLLRYLLTDTRSLEMPFGEAHGLQMECLNTWKVCLTYGLADNVYLEYYQLLIEKLRNGVGMLDRPVIDQEQMAALISCLEMAVCAATTPKPPKAFKESQDGSNMEVEKSEEVASALLNWTHVADLIQPIKFLLTNTLNDLASSYQIKKQCLQVPTACLNFIATYYVHCQSQFSGEDVVNSLQDMEQIYTECIQHVHSIGFTSILSKLSMHSNLLCAELKPFEGCGCLPDYGNSSVSEDKFVPVVSHHTPYGFQAAWYRLVYSFAKVHKGIQSSGSGAVTLTSPLVALQLPDLWTYIRKIASGKSYHQNFFTKFETHFLYYVVKLATLMNTVESDLDLTVIHQLTLKLLTALQYGDEYLAHDLLSTVTFNPIFFRLESTDAATLKLEEMSLSNPIQLRSSTVEQVDIFTERLLAEAKNNLNSIRATILTAFSHSEPFVLLSRCHYVGNTASTESCCTTNIDEPLFPKDWMFMPLIDLFNRYSSVGAEVQNILSTSQLETVRCVLRWIYLLESYRFGCLEGVSVTLKLSRIMCAFLTGNDIFLDRTVHCFLTGILRMYTKPSVLNKMDFSEHIPGLPSFYDLYASLLQQYEAVSYSDSLFAGYVLIPQQRRHSIEYRKAVFTEFTGMLRTLTLPLNELLLPIELYLEPEESNVELIRLYFQALYSGTLRPCWCPVLYLVAVHHVNRFIYTQDKSHTKLKCAMMTQILKSKNEEMKHNIIHYKGADLSKQFGMELYETLPSIRQKFLDSVR